MPSFADFHADADSQIAKACLTDKKCGQDATIAGRIKLTSGTLYTCTDRIWGGDGRVHPINFSDTGGLPNDQKKPPLRRALAEIVELDAPAAMGSVTLSVGTDFKIALAPEPGDSEIDIVVGNLPKTETGGYGDTQAKHFYLLHKLLAKKTSSAVEMDTVNESVEPPLRCVTPFGLPKYLDMHRWIAVASAHARGAPDPGSRPICPMATFLAP